MKKIILISASIILLFSGCNNIEEDKNGQNKIASYVDCQYQGNINSSFKHTAENCNQGVICNYIPKNLLNGLDLNAIEILSSIPNSLNVEENISIFLFFANNLPSDGVFPFTTDGSSNGIYGVGSFSLNSTEALNGNLYSTSGEVPYTGYCKITQYDQANQTISGNFNFKAQYFQNQNPTTSSATFIGSFYKIPITDWTDSNNLKGPCYGTNGSPIGSGGTGSGGNNGGGGNTGGTGSTSTLTFNNSTFTKIDATVNGVTKSANPGASIVFSGTPNSQVNLHATTSGVTSSGTQVGLQMNWDGNYNFPATGNSTTNLVVTKDFFFLKINNNSNKTIGKIYVNYGLTNQTVDNISLVPSSTPYALGYYKAYTNSNVRAETSNGVTWWSWNSLSLPFSNNQSVTVIANN